MVRTLDKDYEIGIYNTLEDMVKAFTANEWQIPVGGFVENRDYETFPRPQCCSTCLWSGVECKTMSNYKEISNLTPDAITCAHWAYFD